MSKRSAKFKVGDTVRVDEPLHVVRVGYPKCIDDFNEEADALLPSLDEWLTAHKLPAKHSVMFQRPLARLLLRADGFGGKEREIHTEVMEEWRGKTGTVKSITRRQTGTYCPGRMSGSGPDWEPEWEPAYLENAKTHRLLFVESEGGCINVEDAHVTLIAQAETERPPTRGAGASGEEAGDG